MDAAQVREWLEAGHEIGSHTVTHPWLTRVREAEAREEISASRKMLEDRFGVAVETQAGGDLGSRMRHALRTSLARGRPALLIGTDVPGYDVAYLAQAAAALARRDAVIGPAEDGGYVLIGLACDLALFSGIAWSTPRVMAMTRERLATCGARHAELPALWDVDCHDDLLRRQGRPGLEVRA